MPDSSFTPDVNATQSFTATGNLALVVQGFQAVSIQLTGTWVGTVFFEGSSDGTNWQSVLAVDPSTGTQVNNSIINGLWVVTVGGFNQIRARVGAYTSGTIVVYLNATAGAGTQNAYVQSLPTALARNGGTGNLTANGQLNGVLVPGCATAVFQVSGTWVGTLTFQATAQDLTTFVTIPAIRLDTNPQSGRDVVTTTTTNGTFLVHCGGLSQVVCKFTAFTSGTATVTAYAGAGGNATYVYPINRGRNVKAVGMSTTFRCVGSGTSPQPICTLENGSSSAVLVAVRDFNLMVDSSAAQTNFFMARTFRTATASGGTVMNKLLTDQTQSSDANVIVRGGASADGTNSAITASGNSLWASFIDRPHSIVGWFRMAPLDLLPNFTGTLDPIILRPGEVIGVSVTTATSANNVSTITYLANVGWEEFVYP